MIVYKQLGLLLSLLRANHSFRFYMLYSFFQKALFLTLILLGMLPIDKSAQIQDLTEDGVSAFIPFEKHGDFLVVRGKMFGVVNLNLIFDTGAENVILFDRIYTDIFETEYDRRIPVFGADLSVELFGLVARNIDLQVGSTQPRTLDILVLEENYSNIDQILGIEIHGIVGAAFFSDYVVEINNRGRYIALHRLENFSYRESRFETHPITIINRKPYLDVGLVMPGKDSLELRFLLDTGAGLPLLIHINTHPALELPDGVVTGRLGVGLGGYLRGYLGRLDNFELWNRRFDGVITNYQDLDTLVFKVDHLHRQGIIGNQLLSRFHIYINYPRSELYIRPYRRYDRPFKFDRSGLTIIATGANLRQYYILDVLKGSPAHEAGLKRGDRLLTFQRLPAHWFHLNTIKRKLKKREGKNIRMKIERAGEEEIFSFKLEELF